MKRATNILLNILIILAGPAATLYMVIAGKGFKIKNDMLFYVGIGAAIAITVSVIVHSFFRKDAKRTLITSVIVTELIYVALAVVDAMHNPKSLMWLPVALLFLPTYTLPTAISASYGIGRLFSLFSKCAE